MGVVGPGGGSGGQGHVRAYSADERTIYNNSQHHHCLADMNIDDNDGVGIGNWTHRLGIIYHHCLGEGSRRIPSRSLPTQPPPWVVPGMATKATR